MKAYAILFSLLLSACSCQTTLTPVTADIAVPVTAAIDIPAEPDWNRKKIKPTDSATEKLRAALADLELADGYIAELHAAIMANNAP